MKARQIKRPRPNLETAVKYLKDGTFSIDPLKHYQSFEEREKELSGISDDLCEIVKKQFPRTQNLEYAILKAHLIIEHAITQHIRGYASVSIDQKEIRFTFSQKLEIAYLFGFGANDPMLLPTVERLNKIRNQVAHSFDMDRNGLDEVLRLNVSESHGDFKRLKPKSDRERIKFLRWICTFICARIAGEMRGEYEVIKMIEEEFISK